MSERDANGRFIKGQSGNPSGRLPKEREERFMEITLSTVTFEDWKAVIKKAVEQAKRGDEKARKFLADFLIGVPKQKHEISGPEDSALTIKFIWDDNQDNKNAEAA